MSLDSDLMAPETFVFSPEHIPIGLALLWTLPELDRTSLERLEAELSKQPQLDTLLVHNFSVGVYARTIVMPAGAFVIGKRHATEHLNIVSKGRATVWSEQAGMVDFEGPVTFNSVPGTKKYLYLHEDTVWTTIHVTGERDLKKLEEALIVTHPLEMI